MDPEITIQITKDEYMSLYRDSMVLMELEAAGVDNWVGYDEVNWDRVEEMVKKEEEAIDG